MVSSGFQELLQQDSLNPDFHFGFLTFSLSTENTSGNTGILSRYRRLARSRIPEEADIGHFGEGLYYAERNNHLLAVYNFNKVKNGQMKYLNYALGVAYLKINNLKKAPLFLKTELALEGGYHEGAVKALIDLYRKTDAQDSLKALIQMPGMIRYFPSDIARELAFRTSDFSGYIIALVQMMQHQFTLRDLMASGLVMLIWLIYLLKLDIFHRENLFYILVTLLLGMVMSFATFWLADAVYHGLGINMNGKPFHDFIAAVIGIGMIEELVKIVPLILILSFTNLIDEPYDYILYAAVSALGFAFIENGLYYEESKLYIIHARAMTTVVGHMFLSSFIAYGLILSKYRYKRFPTALAFILFYGLASILHGAFDFFLFEKLFSLWVILFLISIYLWINFINNSLNNSPFFTYRRKLHTDKLMFYLVTGLTAVLAFEYMVVGWSYGPEVANRSLLEAGLGGSFLILVLAIGLSRLKLVNKQWRLFGFHLGALSSGLKGLGGYELDPQKYLDEPVYIQGYKYNPLLIKALPTQISGTILRSVSLQIQSSEKTEDPYWFLLKIDKPIPWSGMEVAHVLIKFKESDPELEEDEEHFVFLLAIPRLDMLEQPSLRRSSFRFMGWAIVTGRDIS